MDERTKEIYEAALQLPESERETLVELLIPTIDYGDPNENEKAWDEVIQRRYQELVSGEVEAIPWSEVKKSARRVARGAS